jgi:hypothetical protein
MESLSMQEEFVLAVDENDHASNAILTGDI